MRRRSFERENLDVPMKASMFLAVLLIITPTMMKRDPPSAQ